MPSCWCGQQLNDDRNGAQCVQCVGQILHHLPPIDAGHTVEQAFVDMPDNMDQLLGLLQKPAA